MTNHKDNFLQVLIGLGSNQGDKEKNIRRGVQSISSLDGIEQLAVSSNYYTQPLGEKEQSWFVNSVALYRVDRNKWSAINLLHSLLIIEAELGRIREKKWGPRVIDLDLLTFGDLCVHDDELCIPHPQMHKRAFVLIPIKDICPGFILPGGREIEKYLREIDFCLRDYQIWQS